MRYWSGLYPEDTQKLISSGVELIMKMDLQLLGNQEGGWTEALKDADAHNFDQEEEQAGGAEEEWSSSERLRV
jgi:hypothetical protein